jgi:hypothetical protein
MVTIHGEVDSRGITRGEVIKNRGPMENVDIV